MANLTTLQLLAQKRAEVAELEAKLKEQTDNLRRNCVHPKDKRFTYNHGYHTTCTVCGEEVN